MPRSQIKDSQINSNVSDRNTVDARCDGENKPKAHVGRPRKLGKPKVSHAIVATGKGRGRPKKSLPSTEDLKQIIAKGELIGNKRGRPKKSKAPVGKVGRPRKEKQSSDDENDDEVEAPRPVGRPPTGAVNLNIVRTGRGQGRPKKSQTTKGILEPKSPAKGNVAKRKPGRPSKGGIPYEPTGKPRGRPKVKKASDEQLRKINREESDDELEPEEDKNSSTV